MPSLFDPLDVGALRLDNRIVMAPLTRQRAGEDGVHTELHAEHYAQRATAGLLVTEGAFPSFRSRAFPGQTGLADDAQTDGWRAVAQAVHEAGVVPVHREARRRQLAPGVQVQDRVGDGGGGRVAAAGVDEHLDVVAEQHLDGGVLRGPGQGVRVLADEDRPRDPVVRAVLDHGLRDGGDVVVVERGRERGAAVAGGAEHDLLRRVRHVRVTGAVRLQEGVDVDQVLRQGGGAGTLGGGQGGGVLGHVPHLGTGGRTGEDARPSGTTPAVTPGSRRTAPSSRPRPRRPRSRGPRGRRGTGRSRCATRTRESPSGTGRHRLRPR